MAVGDMRAIARSFRILLVSVGAVVVGYVPSLLVASMQPMIAAEFPFSSSDEGLVVAVFFGVSALGSRPCGNLADRLGAARGVQASCVIQICSMLGVVLFAHHTPALFVLAGVSALANALAAPASTSLVASQVAPRLRPFGIGLIQSGGSIAALLTGLAVTLIAVPFGWRWPYVLTAATAVLMVLIAPWGGHSRHQTSTSTEAPALDLRRIYLLGVAAFLSATATVGMSSFIVPYAVRAGIDQRQSGLILAAVGLTGGLGRPLIGALFGRGGPDRSLYWAALVLSAAAAGFGLLTFAALPTLLLGALLVGVGGSWTSLGALVGTALEPVRPGAAIGVLLTGLYAGAVVGPALVGTASAHSGFTMVWLGAAIATVLAALTLVWLRFRVVPPRSPAAEG